MCMAQTLPSGSLNMRTHKDLYATRDNKLANISEYPDNSHTLNYTYAK